MADSRLPRAARSAPVRRALGIGLGVALAACGTVPESPAPDAAADAGSIALDAGSTDVDGGTTAPSVFTDPPEIKQDLQRGDSGLEVGQLQFELKLATGANLDEDGRFGQATLALLHTFEAQARLPTNDVADAPTRGKLAALADEAAHALIKDDEVTGPFEVPEPAEIQANLATIQTVPGEGDKTGTYHGRVGFSWGDGAESESIRQGSPAHLDWVASRDTSRSERRVIGVISRDEGPFDAVNSYDAGDYTWGAYQLIGAYRADGYDPADDELSQGLAAIKRLDPAAFDVDFQRFGLGVDGTWSGGVLVRPSVRVTLALPDGSVLAGKAVWERVGTDALYNQIFIDAGADPRVQRGEVLAAKSVHFDALDAPLANGRPAVREYLTSERAVAAFLDQELNRGRLSTLGVYSMAVDAVCSRRGLDPTAPDAWPETDRAAIEHDLLQEVLAQASTSYATRLNRLLASVFLDDGAHSFVPEP